MTRKLNKQVLAIAVAVVLLSLTGVRAQEPDIVIADFEGDSYGDWTATGNAFIPGPVAGGFENQQEVSNFEGKKLVNTYFQGDSTIGTLTSPPFKIERKYLNFLIGGGRHPNAACLDLVVDGQVVRTATGRDDERLSWKTFDVSDLQGKEARIRIVDRVKGQWGHVNVDHIYLSDERAEPVKERSIQLERQYLNFPVDRDGAKRRMKLIIDGETAREFDIRLADAQPDFYVFMDITMFRGKQAVLSVDTLERDSKALQTISQDDAIKGAENLYREKYRPQFHFTSRRGWNNDPNGLVCSKGEYHLFYQHNPYGVQWGNMHWGHAVSADLVHWTELPIALYPQEYGDWCYSGSAAIDQDNTSGFGKGDEPPMIAAYTSTGRGEAIAFSNDRGRTFTDWEGNPVVTHRGRDPKIFWHEPTGKWVMAVYDEHEGERWIAFYNSPDLKGWKFQSRIKGFYECPEIFSLSVDDDPNNRKWVIYAGDSHYVIGDFDGEKFLPETGKLPGNRGNCFYASQTWNNEPKGRRIRIGWGRVDFPDMPFNQMMTFPSVLTLRTTDDGVRMFAEPIPEIESLRGSEKVWDNIVFRGNSNFLEDVTGEFLDIEAVFDVEGVEEFGLDVRGADVRYDAMNYKLKCLGGEAPLDPVDGKVKLRILVDNGLVEVYGNDGRVYMPMRFIPDVQNRSLKSYTRRADVKVEKLAIHELKSAWR